MKDFNLKKYKEKRINNSSAKGISKYTKTILFDDKLTKVELNEDIVTFCTYYITFCIVIYQKIAILISSCIKIKIS